MLEGFAEMLDGVAGESGGLAIFRLTEPHPRDGGGE